ncbi:MAG: isochorismatase family protein [Rhodocyclaceae bacterium]|jgi:nicotinamidase-related amidase|nr:isochorismatase family protein [Rhodocyclaceae bacterium]
MLVDPKNTAVLFVECQNGLLGEQSVMKAIADAAGVQKQVMGRLARGARAAGALVVHLTYVPVANNRSSNRKAPLMAKLLGKLGDWNPTHPAVQPIPEIGVGPNDLILPRNTGFSPTHGTETFKLLRNLGITQVVLAGISLNVALPVVGTEATDEGFTVVFPRDAVVGTPPEYAEAVIQYTLPFIGGIATVDEILSAWGVEA